LASVALISNTAFAQQMFPAGAVAVLLAQAVLVTQVLGTARHADC